MEARETWESEESELTPNSMHSVISAVTQDIKLSSALGGVSFGVSVFVS